MWSPRYIDAPVLRDENTDEDDLCDDETLYYLTDANMNVTCLVDTGGDAVERYVYDPYGNCTVYNTDWSQTVAWNASKKNNIRFSGYYFDNETGLYTVRNRVYHPRLGRWLSRDPIGYADGMSLYEYVGSSPSVRADPSGRWIPNEKFAEMLGFLLRLIGVRDRKLGERVPVTIPAEAHIRWDCHSYPYYPHSRSARQWWSGFPISNFALSWTVTVYDDKSGFHDAGELDLAPSILMAGLADIDLLYRNLTGPYDAPDGDGQCVSMTAVVGIEHHVLSHLLYLATEGLIGGGRSFVYDTLWSFGAEMCTVCEESEQGTEEWQVHVTRLGVQMTVDGYPIVPVRRGESRHGGQIPGAYDVEVSLP